MDEKDNLCPYSLYAITQSCGKDAITDTYKSKKYTESLLNILKDVNLADTFGAYEDLSFNNNAGSASYDDLNSANKVISKLESDECKSSHATSDAITNKVNQFLLISLSLLLLLFSTKLKKMNKCLITIFIKITTSLLAVRSYPSHSPTIQINPLIASVFQADFILSYFPYFGLHPFQIQV